MARQSRVGWGRTVKGISHSGLSAGQIALMDACPLFCIPPMQQHRPLVSPGRRWVMAADGLYLEARSLALHVMHKVCSLQTAFGEASSFLRTINGRVPQELLDQCVALAVSAGDKETAALIHWNPKEGQYVLSTPDIISAGQAHVTYRDESDDELLVYDFHSHGHLPGYFSGTDDQSDLSRMGPYIAVVAGHCQNAESVKVCSRMCLSPYLVNLG